MNDIVDKLGLHEIPVLELLDASIQNQKFVLSDEAREAIVLTYGRALKAAIELAKEKKNVNGQ